MSAATATPARSAASHDWTLRWPDRTPATLAEACPTTRSNTRIPGTDQDERSLELTALPLDPRCRPDSHDPATGTIARELADTPQRRVEATGQRTRASNTSEVRPPNSRGPAIPGTPLPAACQAALLSMLARYTAIASRLAHQPAASHDHPVHAAVADQLAPCHLADSYLEEILFFRRFNRSEIAALRDGLRVLSAPRGTRIDTRSTLWIVLRGAVQTSLRHGTATCRVRVAGPGRCVGHLSLIAHRTPSPKPILEAKLRERAVLLEVPIERASSLLNGDALAARRFQQALIEDVARALHDADGHLALTPAKLELPSTRLAS